MNNDELKREIADIIQSVKLCTNQAHCDTCEYDKALDNYATDMSCTTLRIADALISAGIGDVKEAEKALEIACEKSNYCPNPSETIYNNDSECFETIDHCEYETEDCASCRNRYFLKQAEKELEEERKDDDLSR